MARQYLRGANGRFAGSTGGGGGVSRGPGRSAATYTRHRTGFMPDRPVVALHGGGRSVAARTYIQQSGRNQRAAHVVGVRNGRVYTPRDTYLTRRAVGGRTGYGPGHRVLGSTRRRVGAPLGNKSIRYVSRAHAGTRAITGPGHLARLYGRTGSSVAARRSRRTAGALPNGYIVNYGPRYRTG
jgi:hypothetical protein